MPKKFDVDITANAAADVVGLWEYIAPDDPDAATAFMLRLEEQINTLERLPERCPQVRENELLGTDYRHLVFGKYRTSFKIMESKVIIMRVLHGTQPLEMGLLEGLTKP